MSCVRALKLFFNKAQYDFERLDITIYNFHPQLPMFLALNGAFFNHRTSRLRFIWPVFNMMLSIVGLTIEVTEIIHGIAIEDYSFASECFAYLLMLGTVPSVYMNMILRNRLAVGLVDKMNSDFVHICNLGPRHKKIFIDGQLVIWKCCFLWMALISISASLYVLNVGVLLFYQIIFATHTEDTTRPLIFPLWFPYSDAYQSPLYEIFLSLEVFMCFLVVQAFGTYVYTLFHCLLHYYTIMDLIILDLEMLFDGLDESVATLDRTHPDSRVAQGILNSRMKRIHTWHNDVFKSMRQIEKLVSGPMLYQMMFTSFGLCVMMYQIADQLNNGTFDYVCIASAISTCMQFWIPCYLGTLIRNKGYAVGDACWNTGWEATALSRLVKTDLVTLILRSQQPLLIKFTGFGTMELETFSSAMSKSYSYFNMLRQSTKGK